MEQDSQRGRSSVLFARVPADLYAHVQEVADRDYDGNLSLLVRLAVKQFLERRREPVTTDMDMRAS